MNRDAETALLETIRTRRDELAAALERYSSHWDYEDPVYRFYHESYKVYWIQAATTEIVRLLGSLAPDRPLNEMFLEIVSDGTGKIWEPAHNQAWAATTRPMVETFFHARYFLEMAVRYAHLEEPPMPLPSGYAALLYLYGLR